MTKMPPRHNRSYGKSLRAICRRLDLPFRKTKEKKMTQDIVERLLDWGEHDEGKINDARAEAADTIAALRAEVARLEAERDARIEPEHVQAMLANACPVMAEALRAQDAEIADLRAEVDRAVELAHRFMEKHAAAEARADAAFAAGVEAARAALEALPRRPEKLGGQTYSYIRLEEAAAAIRALAPVKGDTE